MNRQSLSPKKNHNNRFPYLLDLKVQEKYHKKADHLPEFNFNVCAQTPCKNEISQFELVTNNFTEQQKTKRKPPKIELQSINFQFFKRKVQENSFPNSFLAYTPSKDSQNQHFTIDNEISTIEYPNTKEIKTQNYEIPYNSGEEMYYSGTRLGNNQRELSYIAPYTQDERSFHSRFNEFIRLQLSDTERSSLQSPREVQQKIEKTIKQNFSTWGKVDNTLSTGKKSARLSDFQPSQIKIKSQLEYSVVPKLNEQMSHKKVMKKDSEQTIATVKTKEMSSRLSQNNSFQYQHSISWTSTSSQRLQNSEQTISTRSAIKLKGKTAKKL